MRQIDHERCSELLAPYVSGELDAETSSQVEAHLRDCTDCSEELVGLRPLLEGDAPQLTELERARLRRVVLAEAVPLPDEDHAAPPPAAGDHRGARLYRVLGAAAALAVIGGFAYLGLGDGMGGEDAAKAPSTSEDAVGGADGDTAESFDDQAGSTSDQEAASGPPGSGGGGGSARSTALKANTAAPQPTFKSDLGLVDEKRLDKLGISNLSLVVFSNSYTVADVADHQNGFIEEVAAQAPNARGDDIRECSGALSDQFPNSLLAYAALAEFRDRGDILVLAFAWTDEASGPLEQSMVWAWSIGDCDGIPVHYSTNVIRPRR